MENTNKTTQTFHLGITMAGAASAGCYTAGAMDYLFEILDLWEKAKNGDLPTDWDPTLKNYIPTHDVVIDVMGGTSAGGMTTVMSAIYAMNGVCNPVKRTDAKTEKKNNVLYDSWVLMGDKNNERKLLEKVFDTSDLKANKIQALLNSGFIDNICEEAFEDHVKDNKKFRYVSDDLEVILSHTMLRSVPLAIDFTTPITINKNKKGPEHCSFEHFTVSHFKLNYQPADQDKYLPLVPFASNKTLQLATKATGAFPIGLQFRKFNDELSASYLKNTTEKIAFNRLSEIPAASVPCIKWPEDFPTSYNFISIDGGAINNEPFGEVLAVLKNRYGKKKPEDDYNYAVIMIDPFPDVTTDTSYKAPDDLFSVVPAIIQTLWDQAKVKRGEMLDAYSSDYYRGEIFPLRWKKRNDQEFHPIACGAAMAFAGFLDIDFRHHDFFLGRDNARNFLRTYFTLEYYKDPSGDETKDRIHPIHKDWTPEMINLYKMPGKNGSIFLPIIPDLYYMKEKKEGTFKGPFQRSVKEWPQFDPEKLFSLQRKMADRVEKMLEISFNKMTADKTKQEAPETERWLKKYYRTYPWQWVVGKTGNAVIRFLFWMNKRKISRRITKAAITWVLKDLEAKGLLKQL